MTKILNTMEQAILKAQGKKDTAVAKAIPSPIQPVVTAKLLDALPGLVGAIDGAIRDATGEKVAFVLITFPPGSACHATNISPASDAIKALKALMRNWDTMEGGTVDAAGGVPD